MSTLQLHHQQNRVLPLDRKWGVLFCPLQLRAETASCLQEDKLVTVSSVVTPAQYARGKNVGCGSTVITAVTLKSVILTLALYEGKDGVLLLRWWQSLRGQQNLVIICEPTWNCNQWLFSLSVKLSVTFTICSCLQIACFLLYPQHNKDIQFIRCKRKEKHVHLKIIRWPVNILVLITWWNNTSSRGSVVSVKTVRDTNDG